MYAENFGATSFDLATNDYKKLVDTRLLELRSGLFFEYPKFKGTSGKKILFFLPFWENPTIRESNNARLAEYNVINRNGTLYAHTGTESRTLTVDFNLTLPHIHNSYGSLHNAISLMNFFSKDIAKSEQNRFFEMNTYGEATDTGQIGGVSLANPVEDKGVNPADEAYEQWKRVWDQIHVGFEKAAWIQKLIPDNPLTDTGTGENVTVAEYQAQPWINAVSPNLTEREEGRRAFARNFLKLVQDKARLKAEKTATDPNDSFMRTLKSVNYLVDIIRSCIGNNATSTALGPPMIRIRNGAMYRDTLCICKGYKFSVEDEAGMDLRTLMPYRIKVTLDLVEVRTGNFGTFEPGKYTARDNLVGWESTIRKGGFDPGELKS